MRRGERVRVRIYDGTFVERRVVEVTEGVVLVTTEQEYEAALQEGRTPICAGFRLNAVQRVVTGDEG